MTSALVLWLCSGYVMLQTETFKYNHCRVVLCKRLYSSTVQPHVYGPCIKTKSKYKVLECWCYIVNTYCVSIVILLWFWNRTKPFVWKMLNWLRLLNDKQRHKETRARQRGAVCSSSDSWSVNNCQSWVRVPSKAPVVSLSKKLYSNCLVLVGSRNGFERDFLSKKNACFTIELK